MSNCTRQKIAEQSRSDRFQIIEDAFSEAPFDIRASSNGNSFSGNDSILLTSREQGENSSDKSNEVLPYVANPKPTAETSPSHAQTDSIVEPTTDKSEKIEPAMKVAEVDVEPNLVGIKLQLQAKEEARLVEAYQRLFCTDPSLASTEIVIISGPTGVGKSTLAESLCDKVMSDGGIFCHGRFDSLQSHEPYGAFVSAFTEFTNIIIARGEETINLMRESILSAVGSEGKVLTDTIPALGKILGCQLERRHAIPPSGALNQFKFLFRMFLRAVCSVEHPLVLFLDDIHHADESSMILLQSLVTDVSNKGILFVATVFEDAIPCRKLEDGLDRLRRNDVRVTKIELQTLQEDQVKIILAKLLHMQDNQVLPLAKIIHRQTDGNLFFILELLRALQSDGLLHFDCAKGWCWNEQDICLTFQQTTVSELVSDRVFQLPEATQNMLKVAACMGAKLNVEILNHVLASNVETHLEMAAHAGLITPPGKSYEFAHDGIREAIYNLIPVDDRASFHLDIGRALKSLDTDQPDAYIFVVLGQLEKGCELIINRQERNEVAAWFFRGGTHAVRSSSFKTASRYFLFGIRLLDDSSWREEYDMCLELHNCAVEVEYCNGHFESLDSLAERATSKARCFSDTLRVRICQVYSLGGRNLMSEAVVKGLKVLKALGETFPKNPTRFDWFTAFRKTWRSFRSKSPEAILRLPLMSNLDKLAAMQLMNLMFSFAFTNRPYLAPLLACRMVDLTLAYGLCAVSSPSMMMFASLLIRWGQKVDEGCRCGTIAFAIYDKFGEKAWWGRLCAGYYSCVSAWTHPVREDLAGLKNAHRIALETGDIEIAMVNANFYCWTGFGILPIPVLEKEIRSFVDGMEFRGQKSNMFMILPLWQMCQNLLGMTRGDPKVLTGDVMNQAEYLMEAQEKNPHSAAWMNFDVCFMTYLFGDYESALRHASQCSILEQFPFTSFTVVTAIMFDGLSALALYRKERKHRCRRVRRARQAVKSLTRWSRRTPVNFLGKLLLLKAELASTLGDYHEAAANFTCAIALASKGGVLMLEALANELAGRSHLEQGSTRVASFHFQEAHRLYVTWGAYAKADHLKQELEPHFLSTSMLCRSVSNF